MISYSLYLFTPPPSAYLECQGLSASKNTTLNTEFVAVGAGAFGSGGNVAPASGSKGGAPPKSGGGGGGDANGSASEAGAGSAAGSGAGAVSSSSSNNLNLSNDIIYKPKMGTQGPHLIEITLRL